MPVNEYALDLLARERLAEARRAARERRLLLAGRPSHSRMRAILGGWLVRLGAWVLSGPVLDPR